VFEHNFFHGDMHTGNIILLRNSHFSFIGCRNAGSLEAECLTKQRLFLDSLTAGEYTTAAEIYFLMVSQLPRVDLNAVKARFLKLWRIWETRVHIKELPLEDKSLTYLSGEINKIINDSMFSPLWPYSKLIRTWAHLDIALAYLNPSFNYVKKLRAYFHEEQKRKTAENITHLPERMASAAVALNKMPDRVSNYSLFLEIMMRREAQIISGSASKVDAIIAGGFSLLFFLMSLATAFFALLFLDKLGVISAGGLMGPQLIRLSLALPSFSNLAWIALLVLFLLVLFFLGKQKKHFLSKEHGRSNESLFL